MSNLTKLKTATLRKLAEEQEVEGWEDLKRKELIEVLTSKEEPEEEKKIDAIEGGEEEGLKEESEVKETSPEIGSGITGGRTPAGSKAAIMKAKLDKQKKVTILIPKDKDEKLGSTMSVILNSYRLNIIKGVYVEVPEQVARIVMRSQNQTIEALRGETVNPQSGKKKDSLLDGSEKELE